MLYNLIYAFSIFIIYSFIGWIIEVIVIFKQTKKLVNRGFLMGPYCPVYGTGALIMLFIFSKYRDDPFNLFIMFIFYASILEYFTSYLMEKLFNARWWDYSKNKFNINGRVCLTNALGFGVLGLLLGYYIHPVIIEIINATPIPVLYWIAIPIITIFIMDVIITFNVVTRLRKKFVLINKDMTEDIKKQIAKYIEKNRLIKAFPLLMQRISQFIGKA